MTICPYCGSRWVDYIGVDEDEDELGRVALVDVWQCLSCGAYFEQRGTPLDPHPHEVDSDD